MQVTDEQFRMCFAGSFLDMLRILFGESCWALDIYRIGELCVLFIFDLISGLQDSDALLAMMDFNISTIPKPFNSIGSSSYKIMDIMDPKNVGNFKQSILIEVLFA